MCPVNRIGKVDLLVVSHHGWYQSSSPALVDAIPPRVAIMDNGAKKGGSTPTFETLAKSPGSRHCGSCIIRSRRAAHNTPAEYIANHEGPDAVNTEVDGQRHGSFTVHNCRTGATKDYAGR